MIGFPCGVMSCHPSLHLNRAFIPCSVFAAITIANFGGLGRDLQRAGTHLGIVLHVPLLHVGGESDVSGNS